MSFQDDWLLLNKFPTHDAESVFDVPYLAYTMKAMGSFYTESDERSIDDIHSSYVVAYSIIPFLNQTLWCST